jgi:thioester reductase-like protein
MLRTANGAVIAETELSLRRMPFLGEHRVHGRIVVPGVVFLELVLRCAELAFGDPVSMRGLTLARPLVLSDTDARTVQVVLDPVESRASRARIYSQDPDAGWQQHVEVVVVPAEQPDESADDLEPEAFQRARLRCQQYLDHDEFYQRAWHPEFRLGPSFQLVDSAQRGRSAATGLINPPAPESSGVTAGVRPELLMMDVGVQLIAVAAYAGDDGWSERPVHVGTGYEQLLFHSEVQPGELVCTAMIRDSSDGSVVGDLLVSDGDGRSVAELRGVSFRPVTAQLLDRLVAAEGSGGSDGHSRRPGVPRPDLARLHAAGDDELNRAVLDHLVRLLAAVMGAQPEEVDAEAPITEIADSLMLAEVKAAVDQDFATTLPMEVLFQEDRLTGLAGWLAAEVRAAGPAVTEDTEGPEGTQSTEDTEDTAPEATAPPDPTAPADPSPPAARRPGPPLRLTGSGRLTPMTVADMTSRAELEADITATGEPEPVGVAPEAVLLTGATGFVGAFLLAELLSRRTGEVHCLVRAEDPAHALRRITANLESYDLDVAAHRSRIVPVVGDLAKPFLGLGEKRFAELPREIGSIIHCGGVVKWTYPYSRLEAANVAGTRQVLRLATLAVPRPVHFISTVGVFSSNEYPHETVAETADLRTSGPLVVGYAQSKWVAEQMVRTAHERGLPTTIHRINTGGHSATGAFNRLDHLNMMIKGCVEAGIAPDHVAMQLQPAPIDYVAGAVVELAARPDLSGGTFHLVNGAPMTWRELFDSVEEFGYPLRRLSFDDWRARITSARSGTMALLGLVPFLTDAVDDVKVPVSESTLTGAALAGTGVSCPPLDTALVHTYLRRFVSSNFVPPPADAAGRAPVAAPPDRNGGTSPSLDAVGHNQ